MYFYKNIVELIFSYFWIAHLQNIPSIMRQDIQTKKNVLKHLWDAKYMYQ